MELLADRDPEEARKLLDPVIERMIEAVHHYAGTVNQVMGDGIMALFGAPIAHEDHAVRACYAALRMQEAVELHADEIHRRDGTPIQIRVGINSGEVVVRAIGNDLHMNYTADRTDNTSGSADGANGDAGVGAHHRRDLVPGRGLRPGPAARGGSGKGPRDPDAGLRADRGRPGTVRLQASAPRAA